MARKYHWDTLMGRRMHPYGNEHLGYGDDFGRLAQTKEGQPASRAKTIVRRIAKKARRAKDKAVLRQEVIHATDC